MHVSETFSKMTKPLKVGGLFECAQAYQVALSPNNFSTQCAGAKINPVS